ncbi:hypothetical protein MIND_01043200 [Mycena indigotica]|uniref:Transcription factor TFIIB cyclin-like domain-containing protein n=1 Tax=Mycena indigotica TaxID=2126181 RepID=A0A8H6SA92_9AGAR|nr:uncharacterized protein MIND_01043200 [Mycena indigotica]KAF7295050.1 hypothetical protein MIND_01043200 [Mycena indigotica]
MPPCKQCGVPTISDPDVGLVCPQCGEIVDPDRVVLAIDGDLPPVVSEPFPASARTIKTARNRYLGGADKETRTHKSLLEMQRFINNLSRALLVSSVSDRAYNIFQQAMATGKFRWGRTARLVAGACVSIALRLNHRPELFVDISHLVGEKTAALTSTFSSVISTLKMDQLPLSEPKSHIETLREHLYSALSANQSAIPSTLVSAIKPLSINSIVATATALSDLLVSSVPPSAVARLPASPTACAVLIWAIEGELRTSLAQVGELAAFLATKCNFTKSVVMTRYKIIQDELMDRIDKVEWLDHYDPHNGKSGRAKISRRIVAARGVKAVIEYERECRREEFQTNAHEGEDDDSDGPESTDRRPRKRRRVHALRDATRFLCNPLVGSLPSCLFPSTTANPPPLPLTTYLLTSSICMRRDNLPSRLQLLAASRGGVSSDDIPEDELFEEGELEMIFRSEEEAEGDLRRFYGWEPKEERLAALVALPPVLKERKRGDVRGQSRKASRINAESIAMFMADDQPEDAVELGDLLSLDDDPRIIVEESGDVTGALFGLSRSMIEDRAFSPLLDWEEEPYAEEI